jgi:hypothetical protein
MVTNKRPQLTSVSAGSPGWSEPVATNAPVEDELVEPILRMNILPARMGFFSTSSLPQNSLPTTYQPHPLSLHRQSSRDVERLELERWLEWERGN